MKKFINSVESVLIIFAIIFLIISRFDIVNRDKCIIGGVMFIATAIFMFGLRYLIDFLYGFFCRRNKKKNK